VDTVPVSAVKKSVASELVERMPRSRIAALCFRDSPYHVSNLGLRPVVKLADDFVIDYKRVHQVVGEVVEADLPGFGIDFRGPWMIDVAGIAPIQLAC
jgi:hypothetical protein